MTELHSVKWAKVVSVAKGRYKGEDMPPLVAIHKDGKVVLFCFACEVNKIKGLNALSLLSACYKPDQISFMADVRYKVAENPDEFDNIRDGDLHRAKAAGDKSVKDAIVGLSCDCLGTINFCQWPYEPNGDALAWGESQIPEEAGDKVSGFIPDALTSIMNETAPPIQDLYKGCKEQFGAEYSDLLKHCGDMLRTYTAKALKSQGCVILTYEELMGAPE